MHGAPSCWVWHALCTGHSDAWCTRLLGLGVPGAWAPRCMMHPNSEFGDPVGTGFLACWFWDPGCMGHSHAWGAGFGMPNVFCGVLSAGELCPCLVWGSCCVSCCTPVRGPGVPKCGVLLWGCAPPSIASCRRCPPPLSPSTSLPLSLLPPTPVQPDPCPRAGGPCFVCSPFPSTKSLLGGSRLLVLG